MKHEEGEVPLPFSVVQLVWCFLPSPPLGGGAFSPSPFGLVLCFSGTQHHQEEEEGQHHQKEEEARQPHLQGGEQAATQKEKEDHHSTGLNFSSPD